MIVTITRCHREDGGIFSMLQAIGFDLRCGEDEAKAIPVGRYTMRRDRTGRFRHWVVIGPRVGLSGSGEDWEQVEFHAGNWPERDSDACFLPGIGLVRWPPPGSDVPQLALEASMPALQVMHRVLGDEDHELVVREFLPV